MGHQLLISEFFSISCILLGPLAQAKITKKIFSNLIVQMVTCQLVVRSVDRKGTKERVDQLIKLKYSWHKSIVVQLGAGRHSSQQKEFD
jgi:hypothetical protein